MSPIPVVLYFSDCVMTMDGNSYIGHKNITTGGLSCQRWDSQIPNAHSENLTRYFPDGRIDHNFCRNPEEYWSNPYCFTDTPHQKWDNCDIPLCCKITVKDKTLACALQYLRKWVIAIIVNICRYRKFIWQWIHSYDKLVRISPIPL